MSDDNKKSSNGNGNGSGIKLSGEPTHLPTPPAPQAPPQTPVAAAFDPVSTVAPVAAVVPAPVQVHLVRMTAELHRLALEGKIVDLAFVATASADPINKYWSGVSPNAAEGRLLGHLELLKHEVLKLYDARKLASGQR